MADYGGYHVMTVAGTAISPTTAATGVAVGTTIPLRNVKVLVISNSCDQPVSIAFGGIEVLRIGKNSLTLELGANYDIIGPNTVITAFKTGATTPTTGELSITAIT